MSDAIKSISPEDAAARMLPALDVIAENGVSGSLAATRYATRLRFAIARVRELRASSSGLGGVFEQARLDVALSILDTHARRAGSFVESIALQPIGEQRPYYAPRQTKSVDTAIDIDEATRRAA